MASSQFSWPQKEANPKPLVQYYLSLALMRLNLCLTIDITPFSSGDIYGLALEVSVKPGITYILCDDWHI